MSDDDAAPSLNLVARHSVSLEEMAHIADRLGWRIDLTTLSDGLSADSPRLRWFNGDDTSITLVRNDVLERDYFVVSGPRYAESVQLIKSNVPLCELSDALSQLASATSPEGLKEALLTVAALGLPSYDEGVACALTQALGDDDMTVRIAALTAASYLRWRQLRPLVERTMRADASENIRALANNILGLTAWRTA